ncbi:Site-specific recombinase XerD [Collimonas sp. OK607]|uniref:tyrosine-type recombinase/integrase n=1 Tax=Collimonas sp. OK607 TaxID=1798194 RepID=UPI0008E8BDB6|nr:site-specific integrase [Collimonas sp. OK607]SFA75105.1 Site-specific recombinase XerD [Collimonas sp. OK607]
MDKLNFTKAALDKFPLPAPGIRTTYHDTKATGLQVRVSSNGAKTFSVFRRIKGGQPERITLGSYPDMTIEQARRLAANVNLAIESGANPAEVKRSRRAEMTFGELFAEYLERHSKLRKRTWKEDEVKYHQHLAKPLGTKKLSTVTRREVASIHSSISSAGHATAANRVLALISSVYGWAISAGLWESNPVKGIKRNAEQSRDRFIQADELPHFFAALAAEPNSTIRDYILLSLLTGARRANVLAMCWHDISFERAEWRITRTKNDDPQTVSLSPEAVEILRSRKPSELAKFVFPGEGKAGHLVEPKKGWKRVLERAKAIGFINALGKVAEWDAHTIEEVQGAAIVWPNETIEQYAEEAEVLGIDAADFELGDLRIHDLRRTLGSWQAKTGASMAIIGKSLSHKSVQTTAIYARLDQDPVRESVERATSAMFAAAGLAPKADVVPLKRKR